MRHLLSRPMRIEVPIQFCFIVAWMYSFIETILSLKENLEGQESMIKSFFLNPFSWPFPLLYMFTNIYI